MKKVGVIDIGTNSIRIIIAEIKNNKIINSRKELIMTRLGEGVGKTKKLSEKAIDRSIDALKVFKEIAIKEGISDIRAIATSAVRDAVNKEEFVKRAREEVKINIEVIDGDMEAQLGFKGVVHGIDKCDKDILVIDIGGGSTEFIIGNINGIKFKTSLNVGAVRMTDKHISTDPISDIEFENLKKDIKGIISKVLKAIREYDIKRIIGIGGTVTTLAAIDRKLEIYDSNLIHNYEIKIKKVEEMVDLFKRTNNEERKNLKGLQPKRADIILAGAVILYEILVSLGVDKITISDYDNLEGYIFEKIIG
ncbi:exopolyphosphatase / guanosine-5'-triphosphate,3'-diphosphate pyrophosphatase [Caminicella sporogenes DSM 14501]|uniref:Exopolyphosphatase / guanosine-5'-triphosphate,3'-diphosphate pyrophosphatase n=1 Tax=Caminicella sporogenes DSM 14501 TaxID=1121266 RepID=A0A1M6QSW4_9FIRM|nr:Ppx/GppA phosphatase family protein [Caminicella sporogenes]RKD20927.1 hypothetical protein BET04_08845 [Caminicella sporogenes]SHK23198.1 exopolyphosphatase / guanosine-5'-triphosphate,3'-diphosphate pyrophosphatase [Caminicella sporogenes DSM 14501]